MKAAVCVVAHELGVDRQDPAQLQANSKQLTVDFAEPMYTSLLPSIDALIKPPKGHANEYCFQVFEPSKRPPAHWLHTSLPLSEQGVAAGALLLVIPITCLSRFPARSIKGIEKEGFLIKQSIKSSKETGEKRRWIILKENFLLYYGSQNDAAAAGIVPLEYYNVSIATPTGKKEGMAAFELTPTGTLSKSNVVYRFVSDSEAEVRDWVRLVKDRTSNGARRRVFGVPLTQLAARRGALVNDAVPLPLYKCVRFLDIRLRTEGLFRLSASGGAMESLRTAYDEGQDPDLTAIPGADPHTIAGLLKLYLRELPEPLLTFGLYETLLRTVDPFVQAQSQATRDAVVPQLRAIMQTLPQVHRGVLSFLVAFLGRVAAEASVNLMHAANLAVVFGPNLLRPRDDETNVGVLVANSNHVNVTLQLLIEERARIFDGMNSNAGAGRPIAAAGASAPSASPSPGSLGGLSPAAAAAAAPERPKLDMIQSGDRVIALYDYTPAAAKELPLRKDEVLTVLQKLESGWLHAEKAGGQVGMIPITYVDVAPAAAAHAAPPVAVAAAVTKIPAGAVPKAKQLVRPPPPMTLPGVAANRPPSVNTPTTPTAAPPPLSPSTASAPAPPPSLQAPPALTPPPAIHTPPSLQAPTLPAPATLGGVQSSSSGSDRGSGSDRSVPAQVITFKPHASPLKKPPALTLRGGTAPPAGFAAPPPPLSPVMRSTPPPAQPPPATPPPQAAPPPVPEREPAAPPPPPVPEREPAAEEAPVLAAPTPVHAPPPVPQRDEEAAGGDAQDTAEAPSAHDDEHSAATTPRAPSPQPEPPAASAPIAIPSPAASAPSSAASSASPPPSPKGPQQLRQTAANVSALLPNPAPPPATAPADNAPVRAPASPPRSPRSPRPISMQPVSVSPRGGLTHSGPAHGHAHLASSSPAIPHNFSASTVRGHGAAPPAASLPVDVELLLQAMSSRMEMLENSVALLGRRLAEETRQREQLEARLAAAGLGASSSDPSNL